MMTALLTGAGIVWGIFAFFYGSHERAHQKSTEEFHKRMEDKLDRVQDDVRDLKSDTRKIKEEVGDLKTQSAVHADQILTIFEQTKLRKA